MGVYMELGPRIKAKLILIGKKIQITDSNIPNNL